MVWLLFKIMSIKIGLLRWYIGNGCVVLVEVIMMILMVIVGILRIVFFVSFDMCFYEFEGLI